MARAAKKYSIAEARDQLPKGIHDAESGQPAELTRRGKPVAVLLSIDEYRRLTGAATGFWQAFTAFRDEVNVRALAIKKGDFENLRDRSPGRDVGW